MLKTTSVEREVALVKLERYLAEKVRQTFWLRSMVVSTASSFFCGVVNDG